MNPAVPAIAGTATGYNCKPGKVRNFQRSITFITNHALNMKIILAQLLFLFLAVNLSAQTLSNTFEVRYFTHDQKANGETDFKGETEWMNTDQRVKFLNDYAYYGARFFGNPDLDKRAVEEDEIAAVLKNIKKQPLTGVRKSIPLNGWKSYGYKDGQEFSKQKDLKEWASHKGVSIANDAMLLENALVEKDIDSLSWRFEARANIKIEQNARFSISLGDKNKAAIAINIESGELNAVSAGKAVKIKINTGDWLRLAIEGDFTQKRFNLILNGKKLSDYILMADTTLSCITKLSLRSTQKVNVDDLLIFNYAVSENKHTPYYSSVVLDERFDKKTSVEGWQQLAFNDDDWKQVNLPSVHGGIREKDESYYLRKKIDLAAFERATLSLETIDPGGEVWVNGQIAAVVANRRPVELDITPYLLQNSINLIAIKVKPNKVRNRSIHAPSDPYVGWFLGRASLLLSGNCMIKDLAVRTKSIGEQALQINKIYIQNNATKYFQGKIEINYYPWFPQEGNKAATFKSDIQVKPNIVNELSFEVPIRNPALWSSDSPNLYKVEVILKDKEDNPVDDYVTTVGIRILSQKDGDFYVNGKREMLNGAQIMGFRMPLETISKHSRCAPDQDIVEELVSIKKMSGNLLRMHIHAEKDSADGINDPRFAEIADQLGVYLIWQTPAWIREGEVWNIDFNGYPDYMRQVYNHPSIVMWEASNHPNRFKEHDLSETNDYLKTIYEIIAHVDSSRLISPTSFWQHMHIADYAGTIDYQGNRIKSVPAIMGEMMTRGNQDTYAGYGNDWSKIRNIPNEWAASCLSAKDKAYFNFEHEESTGQPNWNLCKGKPWYLLQSYEWGYDEGSIGRKLSTNEWRASQAWQAFSAWESMKKQMLAGYDGFSWCTLHGGANMGTYQKPLIDNAGHPKLAFYANRMVFQSIWAASNNVDVVYGPSDSIKPVVYHINGGQYVDLNVQLEDVNGKVLDRKEFKGIGISNGSLFKELSGFRFKNVKEGVYVVRYILSRHSAGIR